MRRRLLSLVGEDSNAASVLGANFSAAFVAGSLAAAATCPLDVAKTRRQIEVFFKNLPMPYLYSGFLINCVSFRIFAIRTTFSSCWFCWKKKW